MNNRVDWLMRQQVEIGLYIAKTEGVRAGANHLRSSMVPLHVALRVLGRRK